MMTYTTYNPENLEQWRTDTNNSIIFEQQLSDYLSHYERVFHAKSQRKYFATFIKGLLSTLDRKSLEPIALHFLGEKAVRSMQQFFSRSPLNEDEIKQAYQHYLVRQLSYEGGMLSVDDSSFVKKGCHSIGVKRQYCGRLGKTENCQVGVFLAYASEQGYGLFDHELYIPKEWYETSHEALRSEGHLPPEKAFLTKNQIALRMMNQALKQTALQVRWIGCDAAYGNDHAFLDGLDLPKETWYFAATNAKEQIYMERPEISLPERTNLKGRPRKHAEWSSSAIGVKSIAEDTAIPWIEVTLTEGAKGPIVAERKIIRCVACRKDGNRNYLKPGSDIWLYLRRYADGEIKYFTSNAPQTISYEELDYAATLRWPIEQCFEECKSHLGMSHYECRTYTGWMRHMLFVMIAHLFTTQIKEIVKKKEFQ